MSEFMAGFLGGVAGVLFGGILIAVGITLDVRRTRRRVYGDYDPKK